MKTALQIILFTVLFIFISSSAVFTQWTDDPVIKTELLSQVNLMEYRNAVPDNLGGGIVTWSERKEKSDGSLDFNLYAQRFNSDGMKLWGNYGIRISNAKRYQWQENITSDGSGGAIIVWADTRMDNGKNVRSDIYAQRIDSSGKTKWKDNGIPVCSFYSIKNYPFIINDGAGGAVIFWRDTRQDGSCEDIYAQRINSSGQIMWNNNGVLIQETVELRGLSSLIKGREDEIILVFSDLRNKLVNIDNPDLFAQKINLSGQILWDPDGIPICTEVGAHISASTVSDGSGGLISFWSDNRTLPTSGFRKEIYAQKINASGIPQWTTNGILICRGSGIREQPIALGDGQGGAFVQWNDRRYDNTPSRQDIFAQKINSAGIFEWMNNGIPICTAPNFQDTYKLFSDGKGNVIFSWLDNRFSTSSTELYAQKVNSSGIVQWEENGIRLTNNFYAVITSPHNGDTWVAGAESKISWESIGTGTYVDIDLSTDSGTTWTSLKSGVSNSASFSIKEIPNYLSNRCKVRIIDPGSHYPYVISDGLFSIEALSNVTQPTVGTIWKVGERKAVFWKSKAFTSKTVNIDLSPDSGLTWITIAANVSNSGGYTIPKVPMYPSIKCKIKVSDVSGSTLAVNNGLFTIEEPVITITSPAGGEVWKVGSDAIMRWKTTALSKYVNIQLSTNGGTSWIFLRKDLPDDGDWHIYNIPNYPSTNCKIRITDISGYPSAVSNGYFTITNALGKFANDEEVKEIPTEFALDQNYPNPFNPVTVISYQLPVISHATLKVYDLLGKEVATLVNEEKAPGYYQVKFDGSNLSSGVYIYRLNVGSFTSTKKLLLMK